MLDGQLQQFYKNRSIVEVVYLEQKKSKKKK